MKPGNYRLALLELDYKELDGLKQVIDSTLEYADKEHPIILNFEEGNVAANPTITTSYTPNQKAKDTPFKRLDEQDNS